MLDDGRAEDERLIGIRKNGAERRLNLPRHAPKADSREVLITRADRLHEAVVRPAEVLLDADGAESGLDHLAAMHEDLQIHLVAPIAVDVHAR